MGDKKPIRITEIKIKIGADEQVFCFSPGRKDEISVTVVLSDESVITVDAKGALLEKANGGRSITIVNSTGVQDGDNCQQSNIFRS